MSVTHLLHVHPVSLFSVSLLRGGLALLILAIVVSRLFIYCGYLGKTDLMRKWKHYYVIGLPLS